MLVLLGAALLVAQLVNFALILNERQKLGLAQNEGPAISRFVQVASDLTTASPDLRFAVLDDASERGARFTEQKSDIVAADIRDETIETRLAASLASHNIPARNVRAGISYESDRPGRKGPPMRWLMLSFEESNGQWLHGRLPMPPRDRWLVLRLAAATLAVYAIVLGASIFVALRLARPLRNLTLAAESFRGRDRPETVEPSGPDDLRKAIEAFNAMNARVVALLDEKDRMLGALGHDLRTPLASLRIRVESMEPEDEREAAIAKIGEMTEMVEEILVLARSGRAREPAKRTDVAALVDSIVADQQELGHNVDMPVQSRVIAEVQPGLLRRAVSNLIDNAVKYAGDAEVSVRQIPGAVEISVRDHGPGIPEGDLVNALEPFYRGEDSRNRTTGGTGLGLAIARSIAESHGGTLRLSNIEPEAGTPNATGLVATLTIPV